MIDAKGLGPIFLRNGVENMLVTMKEILDRANSENYAVLAPNVFSEPDARTCLEAAEMENSPIILNVAMQHTPDIIFFGSYLTRLCEQASVPVAINLDHGQTFVDALKAIKAGFTSIMVDRSMLPFEQNVSEVKELVNIAHPLGISVEAELGQVGYGKDYMSSKEDMLTDPEQAAEYISRTNVDCLAVAIGTAHGSYVCEPTIDFARLEKIKNRTNFPLVLHGGSGTGDDNIAKACKMGINKVNVCNELLGRMYDNILSSNLSGDNAYDFWKIALNALRKRVRELIHICGSNGKKWQTDSKGLPHVETSMHE